MNEAQKLGDPHAHVQRDFTESYEENKYAQGSMNSGSRGPAVTTISQLGIPAQASCCYTSNVYSYDDLQITRALTHLVIVGSSE